MNTQYPEYVVGVHVGNPTLGMLTEFAPPGNNVGTLLLHRALELALLIDGLTREDCCGACGAQLNDSIFEAGVSDPIAAAETIKRELTRFALFPCCQIGVLEEGRWRCIYPSPRVRMNWLMDRDRLEFALAQMLQRAPKQAAAAIAAFFEGKQT